MKGGEAGFRQISMLDIIIIILVVLGIFGLFVLRTGIRQRLLNELATCYNEATQLLQSCTIERMPAELMLSLNEPLKDLANDLNELEKVFNSEAAIFKYRQIIRDDKPLIEAKSQKVKDLCSRWNEYAAFKQQLTDELRDLISQNNTLIERMHELARYDKNLEDVIQIRATTTLNQLEEYQNLYRELRKTPFADYDPEAQVPHIPKEFWKQVDLLINEIKYFRNHIKVYISGLFRKSIYYITLEDATDKSPRRHADTIQVSYKTFSECEKGSPYKWNIIIGGKYVSSEQNVTIKSFKDDVETKVTHKLTKEQFEQIFKSLTFNRKFEEMDENEIPYQISVMDLEFLILEKKANDFDVTYHSDLFEGAVIYDFLSYNKSFELAPLLGTGFSQDTEISRETADASAEENSVEEEIAETEAAPSAEVQTAEEQTENIEEARVTDSNNEAIETPMANTDSKNQQ